MTPFEKELFWDMARYLTLCLGALIVAIMLCIVVYLVVTQ